MPPLDPTNTQGTRASLHRLPLPVPPLKPKEEASKEKDSSGSPLLACVGQDPLLSFPGLASGGCQSLWRQHRLPQWLLSTSHVTGPSSSVSSVWQGSVPDHLEPGHESQICWVRSISRPGLKCEPRRRQPASSSGSRT